MRIVLCYLLIKILFEWTPSVYCFNPSLKTIANLVTGGISNRLDPCVDFYSHVCNRWPARKFLLTINSKFLPTLAKDILQYGRIEPDNIKLQRERLWLTTCMYSTFRNELHVLQVIVYKSGGLLLAGGSSMYFEVNRNWQNVAKFYSTQFGTAAFFNIQLNKNKILKIAKPTERFYEELILLDEKAPKMFQYFMPNSFQINSELIGIAIDQLRHLNRMLSMLDWRNGIVMSIDELQKLQNSWNTEQINWLEYLNGLAIDTGIILSDSDKIEIDIYYLKGLSDLLKNVPNSIIVNYIHYFHTMANEFYDVLEFTKQFYSPEEKATFCVYTMPIYDGYSSILKRDIPEERINVVKNMFQELRKEMRNEIKKSWLGSKTKNYALNILRRMKLSTHKIYTFSTEYYGQKISYDFSIGSKIIENLINYKKAQIKFLLTEYIYRKSNVRNKRGVISPIQYHFYDNDIELSLGSLFEPMSRVEAPLAVNFGFLGFIIGHEMSHMFNYKHSYDMIKGKPKKISILNNKYQCFERQFNNYKVNGIYTRNENMADSLGIKIAFNAFRSLFAKNNISKIETLPGFEKLTAEKLFFYTFASSLCETPRKNYHFDDVHSPNVLRVKGALSNSIEFAKTFNCPVGSIMNPEEKCDLLSNVKLNIVENNNENEPPQKRFKHD